MYISSKPLISGTQNLRHTLAGVTHRHLLTGHLQVMHHGQIHPLEAAYEFQILEDMSSGALTRPEPIDLYCTDRCRVMSI